MKRIFLSILLVSVIIFSALANGGDSRGYKVKVGDMAPDFEMKLTNGNWVKLSDLKGKVVMLQFTASWCGVCRKEMPHIENEIWKIHKNKEFVLFGIDRDEPIEKAEKLIKATGVTYPIGLDEGANIFAKYAYRKSGVTRNVIIDRDGKIIFLTRLFNAEEFNAMKEVIENELKK
ncbi:MAG: TlpA family protein disulfide reductase [Marinifilum sp.]|jgi:peroxiredoxin|nr:TlpA family protein disulfide reductase [Marinifilum sp.]